MATLIKFSAHDFHGVWIFGELLINGTKNLGAYDDRCFFKYIFMAVLQNIRVVFLIICRSVVCCGGFKFSAAFFITAFRIIAGGFRTAGDATILFFYG